jgi:hypothetical protein
VWNGSSCANLGSAYFDALGHGGTAFSSTRSSFVVDTFERWAVPSLLLCLWALPGRTRRAAGTTLGADRSMVVHGRSSSGRVNAPAQPMPSCSAARVVKRAFWSDVLGPSFVAAARTKDVRAKTSLAWSGGNAKGWTCACPRWPMRSLAQPRSTTSLRGIERESSCGPALRPGGDRFNMRSRALRCVAGTRAGHDGVVAEGTGGHPGRGVRTVVEGPQLWTSRRRVHTIRGQSAAPATA